MVTGLSSLTNLNSLVLEFESPQSLPDRETRHPPTRPILPALTHIHFKGDIEYLEDLVARIDAPLLNDLTISSFNQSEISAPQFVQFYSRTPGLKARSEARVTFDSHFARITLPPLTFCSRKLCVVILHAESYQQRSFLERICTLFLPSIFALEDLYIYEDPRGHSSLHVNYFENTRWFEILCLFTAVKNLYVSKGFTEHFAHALQGLVSGGMTQVLPNLRELFLESPSAWPQESGPIWVGIEQFIAVRQSSGFPVALSHWERNYLK